MAEIIDVAIIGGGPAGLTAAATLARQLHSAVVFDTQTYRNSAASHLHMVPTWDHRNPASFRAATKQDILARYSTIKFADVGVTKIEKKSDSQFFLTDAAGKEWEFHKIILAVGSSDTFPDIEGYAELWTKRIFHCLFCHGYEDRGAPSAGVLAVFPVLIPPLAIHMAENAAQLADNVTLYTNGNADIADQIEAMAAATPKFHVEVRSIRRLVYNESSNSVTVELADGSVKEERFLVHNPLTGVQGPFVQQLGLATTALGDIQADAPAHQTSIRGVFAAGDCITPYKVVPGAISSGCNAAVAVSSQLQAEKYGQPPMF